MSRKPLSGSRGRATELERFAPSRLPQGAFEADSTILVCLSVLAIAVWTCDVLAMVPTP